MSYKNLIKDVRNTAVGEAIKYVRDKMKLIMCELTREVHMILMQFLSYRRETANKEAYLDTCRSKFADAVIAYGVKAPVMEATFGMWEKTAFKLYDCLIPRT